VALSHHGRDDPLRRGLVQARFAVAEMHRLRQAVERAQQKLPEQDRAEALAFRVDHARAAGLGRFEP
jgi:hypothetical protein